MAIKKTYNVKFKRRRKQKTNFKKRLATIKSKKTRLVVRRTTKNIITQLINYTPTADKTVVAVNSQSLKNLGWNYHKGNLPSAYLTGLLLGKKGLEKGIKEAILDIGLQGPIYGSALFATLKGVVDAGIKINHNEKALPKEERIQGKHIQDYASSLTEEDLKKRFSENLKNNADPRKISDKFNEVKEKIMRESK